MDYIEVPSKRHPKAWRINDAADAIGISKSSLYELVQQKKLKLITIAGRRLVPDSELERLVAESMSEAA